VAVVVLFLLFFFRFDSPSTPAELSPSDVLAVESQQLVGFRPLNESKIAIVTFHTEQKSFTHLSLKNKAHYANVHNYDFIIDYESHNDRGMMWHKFDMVQRVINGSQHDWVWWIDFDTLVMNMNTRLEDVIADALANVTNPDAIDFLFTPDCFELNAGSFLTRATPRAHSFFNRVVEYHNANATYEHQMSEQDCMRDIMFKSAFLEDKFLMLPQHSINAFPEEIPCWDRRYKKHYEPGMFFIHFAGAWAHVKEEDPTGFLMRKYQSKVIMED